MASQDIVEPRSMPLLDSRFMWRVFYIFAALAVISVAISVAGRYAGRSIAMAGHTDDASIAEVVIGNNVIAAPRNMIRFEQARRNGVASRLDLYLRWPDMNGYTSAARNDFNHAGGTPNILFASLSESLMSRDMSGRFEPIYSLLTEPTGETVAGDLAVHRFTAKSGYVNEIMLTGVRPGKEPYAVRCLDGDAALQSLAPCERDVHIGEGLSLVYRFPRELLGDWKTLDAAVITKIQSLLKTAD
jgi:hypothetical protein